MIISISGKAGSGKDEVGKIIQEFLPEFEIKKWATKVKEIVSLLIGCSMEDLENREFKEKELGEEWWYIKKWYPANPEHKKVFTLIPYIDFDSRIFDGDDSCAWEVIKTTPRLLLQLMGTECGRDILHPNIWVNALMNEYTKRFAGKTFYAGGIGRVVQEHEYPNWIITDTRFPNELKAVEDRGGITIRVNRPNLIENNHPSETSLDSATFDYVVYNTGTIEDLKEKVKEILIKENLFDGA